MHRNHQQPAQSSLFDDAAAALAGEPELRPAATPHEAAVEDLLTRFPSLAELEVAAAGCASCALRSGCAQVVFGEGNRAAGVMFIGEGPGETEDQLGRPFVGRAGQLLDKILEASGFPREEVYIANVVKCRPPANRDPLPGEILACSPWLDRQIDLIGPRVVVTLGRFSLARFVPDESIGKVHGRARQVGDIVCFPMYHPAAALHQGSLRKTIEEDMQRLPDVLKELKRAAQEGRRDDGGQQLTLF